MITASKSDFDRQIIPTIAGYLILEQEDCRSLEQYRKGV